MPPSGLDRVHVVERVLMPGLALNSDCQKLHCGRRCYERSGVDLGYSCWCVPCKQTFDAASVVAKALDGGRR